MEKSLWVENGKSPVLQWSDEDFHLLRPYLRKLGSNDLADASSNVTTAAIRCGLVFENGGMTQLGERVAQLAEWESFQDGDEIQSILNAYSGASVCGPILEVGCSTGYLLRSIHASAETERVGVDIDPLALAFGSRCAKQDGTSCQLDLCSACSIPYPDGHFRWVICRNALTYMHQRKAVGEMCRLLSEGGFLLIRCENFWYDLNKVLTRSRGWKSLACNVRDATLGAIHAATGWQRVTADDALVGRSFCSVRRLRGTVERLGCTVLQTRDALNCPEFFRQPTQTTILCQKQS